MAKVQILREIRQLLHLKLKSDSDDLPARYHRHTML
jgi:hypothetical protein